MGKTALIAGATGLIGGHCLNLLLDSPDYDKIIAIVRKNIPVSHPKLQLVLADFDQLEALPTLKVDDVFCCLGTTIKKAGTKEAFYKVDFSYTLALAQRLKQAGAAQFLLVSALGADARSSIFYNHVKGEVEEALTKIPFKSIQIFRPSLLLGDRQEFRLGEKLGMAASKVMGPLFQGPLQKWRPIEAQVVAKALVKSAQKPGSGVRIHESHQIKTLAL